MPADTLGRLYVDEDNAIWLRDLYDRLANDGSGAYINDATVTWVIRAAASNGDYDPSGSLVSNGGGTMTYKPGSNGDYYGAIEDDAALTAGTAYWVVATITASGDRVGVRKVKYVAAHHGSR